MEKCYWSYLLRDTLYHVQLRFEPLVCERSQWCNLCRYSHREGDQLGMKCHNWRFSIFAESRQLSIVRSFNEIIMSQKMTERVVNSFPWKSVCRARLNLPRFSYMFWKDWNLYSQALSLLLDFDLLSLLLRNVFICTEVEVFLYSKRLPSSTTWAGRLKW